MVTMQTQAVSHDDSDCLWVVWGWHSSLWALVLLQAGLAAMEIHGARENES